MVRQHLASKIMLSRHNYNSCVVHNLNSIVIQYMHGHHTLKRLSLRNTSVAAVGKGWQGLSLA